MSTFDHEMSQRIGCMQVWGGNQSSDAVFEMPGLDVSVWSRPAGTSQVCGGHLHLVSSCASGRITRILLADISAPGELFHKLAGEFRDLMLNNVNRVRQVALIHDMRRRIADCSHRGGFVSTLITTYFAPTRKLSVCNAGHPMPLVYRAGNSAWSKLSVNVETRAEATRESESVEEGVVGTDEYQHFSTRLNEDDILLSHSGAVSELCDERGQLFTTDRLLGLVQEQADQNEPVPVNAISDHLMNHEPSAKAGDDLTLFAIRGTAKKVRLADNLLAPVRLFGSPKAHVDIH